MKKQLEKKKPKKFPRASGSNTAKHQAQTHWDGKKPATTPTLLQPHISGVDANHRRKVGAGRREAGSPYLPSARPGFATAKIYCIHRLLGGLPELSPRYSGSIIMGRNSNYFACLSGNCNISCLLNDSSSGDYFHIKPRSVCCHFKKN